MTTPAETGVSLCLGCMNIEFGSFFDVELRNATGKNLRGGRFPSDRFSLRLCVLFHLTVDLVFGLGINMSDPKRKGLARPFCLSPRLFRVWVVLVAVLYSPCP